MKKSSILFLSLVIILSCGKIYSREMIDKSILLSMVTKYNRVSHLDQLEREVQKINTECIDLSNSTHSPVKEILQNIVGETANTSLKKEIRNILEQAEKIDKIEKKEIHGENIKENDTAINDDQSDAGCENDIDGEDENNKISNIADRNLERDIGEYKKVKYQQVIRNITPQQKSNLEEEISKNKILAFCEKKNINPEHQRTLLVSFREAQIANRSKKENDEIVNTGLDIKENDEVINTILDKEKEVWDSKDDILLTIKPKQRQNHEHKNSNYIEKMNYINNKSIFSEGTKLFKAITTKFDLSMLEQLQFIADENSYEDLKDFLDSICEDNLLEIITTKLKINNIDIEKIKNISKELLSLQNACIIDISKKSNHLNDIKSKSTSQSFDYLKSCAVKNNRLISRVLKPETHHQSSILNKLFGLSYEKKLKRGWGILNNEEWMKNEFYINVDADICYNIGGMQTLKFIVKRPFIFPDSKEIQLKIRIVDYNKLITGYTRINIPSHISCKDIIGIIDRYYRDKIFYIKKENEYPNKYINSHDFYNYQYDTLYFFNNYLISIIGISEVDDKDVAWLNYIQKYIKKINNLYYCDLSINGENTYSEIIKNLKMMFKFIENCNKNYNVLSPGYKYLREISSNVFFKVEYIIIPNEVINTLENEASNIFS